jgi:hypothetical protein
MPNSREIFTGDDDKKVAKCQCECGYGLENLASLSL